MKASIKSLKENLLYQKGYRDGFIEGQTGGVEMATKIVESTIGKSILIPKGHVLSFSDKIPKKIEMTTPFTWIYNLFKKSEQRVDFESNPDGNPMRITPIEEAGKK